MIQDKIKYLSSFTDQEWGIYAFSRDPLYKKINPTLMNEFIEKSIECGHNQAKLLLEKYPNKSIKEIANIFNLEINVKDSYGTDNYIMFACYNSPNKITLFKQNIELGKEFIREEQIAPLLENVNIEDLLIAHELFHYFEEKIPEIYTKNAKIVLWSIGKFQYKSRLVAVSEIAAMCFAKELLSLSYNPFVFDVLMLYPHNWEKTDRLFNDITAIIEGVNNYE